MEYLDPPPPPPQIKDGKMARFALRGASPLIWGNRGLLIQFILDKINGKLRPPPPPSPPTSRMGKWRVFALRVAPSLILGDGGLLFHFTLSKIVV